MSEKQGCGHTMISGPRRGQICSRQTTPYTKSDTPVCFHHTPERLQHQADRQKRNYADRTSRRSDFDVGCAYVMKAGKDKGQVCSRQATMNTRSRVPVCFYHTPERLRTEKK